MDNWLQECLLYSGCLCGFLDDFFVLLMDDRLLNFMNNLLMALMDDWLMNLPNFLFVNNGNMVLMNNVLMLLMDDILMMLMYYILMMFMNNFSVVLLHYRLGSVHFYSCWKNVLINDGRCRVSFKCTLLIMSDHGSSLLESSFHNWSLSRGCVHLLLLSLELSILQVSYILVI